MKKNIEKIKQSSLSLLDLENKIKQAKTKTEKEGTETKIKLISQDSQELQKMVNISKNKDKILEEINSLKDNLSGGFSYSVNDNKIVSSLLDEKKRINSDINIEKEKISSVSYIIKSMKNDEIAKEYKNMFGVEIEKDLNNLGEIEKDKKSNEIIRDIQSSKNESIQNKLKIVKSINKRIEESGVTDKDKFLKEISKEIESCESELFVKYKTIAKSKEGATMIANDWKSNIKYVVSQRLQPESMANHFKK